MAMRQRVGKRQLFLLPPFHDLRKIGGQRTLRTAEANAFFLGGGNALRLTGFDAFPLLSIRLLCPLKMAAAAGRAAGVGHTSILCDFKRNNKRT